jgi:phage tail-like protein
VTVITGTRHDPYLAFAFLVEIDGLEAGGFSEVLGLSAELEVLDYREGGVNEFMHRLPGPVRHPGGVTLRHGLTDATELWEWWRAAVRGDVQRHNTSILLLGADREVVRRWDLVGAYPVRWTGPELRAGAPAVAVEALELAHRGMGVAR